MIVTCNFLNSTTKEAKTYGRVTGSRKVKFFAWLIILLSVFETPMLDYVEKY